MSPHRNRQRSHFEAVIAGVVVVMQCDQFGRHFRHRHHQIDAPRRDRVARHVRIFRLCRVLRDHKAALFFDAAYPRVPSAPVPESKIAIASFPYAVASVRNNKSIEVWRAVKTLRLGQPDCFPSISTRYFDGGIT